jgi:hypothetical protein
MQIVRTYKQPLECQSLVTIYKSLTNEYYVVFTNSYISPLDDKSYISYKNRLKEYGWKPETDYYVDPIGKNRRLK